MLRFVPFLALVLSGCDLFASDPPPSTFGVAYSGARSGDLRGSVFAQSFRYTGLGTSDFYQIMLTGSASEARAPSGGVVFGIGGLDRPVGTYSLDLPPTADGPKRASAWITVGGGEGGFDRTYYAMAGTLRIERVEGNRVRATFRVTDSFLWGFLPEDTIEPSDPDSVVFEGHFDATLGE